jgi:alpha-tubulin suppressor-like RCC1 family protein
VSCTGYNAWGQLGLGTASDRNIFGSLTAFNAGGVTKIIGSASHYCALDNSSFIWCWGYNGYGQVGNGSKVSQKTPNKVGSVNNLGGINGFVDFDMSKVYYDDDGTPRLPGFVCGLKVNGEVWCWGYNGSGQLGRGFAGETPPKDWLNPAKHTVLAKPSPVPDIVMGIGTSSPGAIKIAVGGLQVGYACAITNSDHSDLIDGDKYGDIVKCWGENHYGQLGDGTRGDPRIATYYENRTPVVANLPGVTGGPGGKRVIDIAVVKEGNNSATCAIVEVTLGSGMGEVYCWGNNDYGQVGAPAAASIPMVDASLNPHLYVPTPRKVGTISTATAIKSGGSTLNSGKHFCALLADTTAWCWGQDYWGTLGDGVARETSPSSDWSYTPKQVKKGDATTPMTQIIDFQLAHGIAPGRPTHGCAIVKTGTYTDPISNNITDMGDVYCWGGNTAGELGLPQQGSLPAGRVDSLAHPIPTKVNFPPSVAGTYRATKLITGSYTECAILAGIQQAGGAMVLDPATNGILDNGRMFCWGYNAHGSLGRGIFAKYNGIPDFPN